MVTSKPKVYADRILVRFDLCAFFADVYGAELSGERSAKSELLAHVLQQEQLRPLSACMIGDRKHDIQGAKAHAGVLGLGVLWGFGTRHELEEAGADDIVETVQNLAATVHRVTQACS